VRKRCGAKLATGENFPSYAGVDKDIERGREAVWLDEKELDIVPGNAKCTHEDNRLSTFPLAHQIRPSHNTTARSFCIRVSITRLNGTPKSFRKRVRYLTARQVLRSLPNYQLIFVFTALRCTFVTLSELDAAL